MDTPSQIVASVKLTLLEDNAPGSAQWEDDELLSYLNEGAQQIVAQKPTSNMVPIVKTLVAGIVQTLTAGDLEIFDVLGNGTAGASCLRVSRNDLDIGQPQWRAATQSATVEEWSYDKKTPKVFFVNPPNDGTGTLQMVVARLPSAMALTGGGNVWGLGEEYIPVVKMWMLGRAYQKNLKVGDIQKSTDHFKSFTGLLTGRWNVQQVNQGAKADGNPNQPA